MMILRLFEYFIYFVVLYFTVCFFLIFLKNKRDLNKGNKKYKKFEPNISVVIPAYNEEKYLGKCIKSVLNSDYKKEKMEIIVVNDGSSDGTKEIAESYGKKYKNIKIINKENTGKADSLNKGIENAKGEIIFTLDADSYIKRKSIKKVLRYFDDDVAAVTSAVKIERKKKNGIVENLQRIEYIFTIFNRKIFSFIDSVYVTPGPLSAFRSEVLKEVGGFNSKNIMEDQEMAYRIQSANYRIESCTNAIVFTKPPENLKSFYKQRVRWQRGGIRNALDYRNLIGTKYGDFGFFIMPYSILTLFFIAIVFSLVGTDLLIELENPFFDLLLSFKPIHFFSLIVFSATLLWIFLAFKKMGHKISFPTAFSYTIAYCYLICFFTIVAIIKEIIEGRKFVW